jgi:hypothetical protein
MRSDARLLVASREAVRRQIIGAGFLGEPVTGPGQG